jgi:hypothetical protein
MIQSILKRLKHFWALELVILFGVGGLAQASVPPLKFNVSDVYFARTQQGNVAIQTIQLFNRSNREWNIHSLEFEGHDMVFSVYSLCGERIQARSSCSVDIEFFPQDFWGDFSGELQLKAYAETEGGRQWTHVRLSVVGSADQAY